MFCLYKDETRAFSCLEDRLLQIAGMLCKGLNSSNRVKNIPNSLLVGGLWPTSCWDGLEMGGGQAKSNFLTVILFLMLAFLSLCLCIL